MSGSIKSDKYYNGRYEQFRSEANFFVNYHFADRVKGRYAITAAHWHEHIELLCICHGILRIYIQGRLIEAGEGDIVVINSGETHAIPEKEDDVTYECLIPHKALCSRMSLPVEKIKMPNCIRSEKYTKMFRNIMQELKEQPEYYEASVQGNLLVFLVGLIREHKLDETAARSIGFSSKEKAVQKAIEYIQENYTTAISTDDVCGYLGFDKSYVCNSFKKITGTTILDYTNMIRCQHAKELLLTGEQTVAECAIQSGFSHLPYFTKTYKRYIGELPSVTARVRKQKE